MNWKLDRSLLCGLLTLYLKSIHVCFVVFLVVMMPVRSHWHSGQRQRIHVPARLSVQCSPKGHLILQILRFFSRCSAAWTLHPWNWSEFTLVLPQWKIILIHFKPESCFYFGQVSNLKVNAIYHSVQLCVISAVCSCQFSASVFIFILHITYFHNEGNTNRCCQFTKLIYKGGYV